MVTIQNPFFQYQSSKTDFQPYVTAAGDAAQIRADAAANAGQLGIAGLQNAQTMLNQGNTTSLSYRQPFIDASQQALLGTRGLLGLDPNVDPTQMLRNTPGYQFQLQQGVDAINRGAAAQGKLYSGQTLQALQEFGQGLADNTYQQAVGNYSNLMGQTSPFAAQQSAQQYALGQDQGQYSAQIGQTQADAELARAQAQAQGLLDIGQAQVAQSSIGGQLLQTPSQRVEAGGSESPWGNEVGQQEIDRSYNNSISGGGGGTGQETATDAAGILGASPIPQGGPEGGGSGGGSGGSSGTGGASGFGTSIEPVEYNNTISGGASGQQSSSLGLTPGTTPTGNQDLGGAADVTYPTGSRGIAEQQLQREASQREAALTTQAARIQSILPPSLASSFAGQDLSNYSPEELGQVETMDLGGAQFLYVPTRKLGELFGGQVGYIPIGGTYLRNGQLFQG